MLDIVISEKIKSIYFEAKEILYNYSIEKYNTEANNRISTSLNNRDIKSGELKINKEYSLNIHSWIEVIDLMIYILNNQSW